ncbi:MAG: hypothetical protein ACOYM7_04760 [Paludibacter sp.]
MKKFLPYFSASVLGVFGLLTLFMTTSVILDLFGIRAKEGNYVLFVVWANFICGLLYLAAAYGFIGKKKWTAKLLGLSTSIVSIAFIGLLFHIKNDGIYENETVGAMLFRIILTVAFAVIAYFLFSRKRKISI